MQILLYEKFNTLEANSICQFTWIFFYICFDSFHCLDFFCLKNLIIQYNLKQDNGLNNSSPKWMGHIKRSKRQYLLRKFL